MMVLALILGVLAWVGWGMAAHYWMKLDGALVLIHIAEGCLKAADDELRYWERVRVAEAEPPLTEIPAVYRQAFGKEGE